MKIAIIFLVILLLLVILGWTGLNINPAPFAPYPERGAVPETVPLPDGLPAPVERFYRELYGDQVPVIESAVITGRAKMRPFGPFYLPARFRFTHTAGQDYRHYIEATFFGFPLFKVNERYLEGRSVFVTPGGRIEDDPQVNQGANLGLWSESIWLPSIFITDPRVRWEPVDENTALLVVPFEDTEETYVVRFDPESGMLHFMESMRYKGADDEKKTLWINESLEWGLVDGAATSRVGSATWIDDGDPWAIFTVEELVYNADEQDYLRQEGE